MVFKMNIFKIFFMFIFLSITTNGLRADDASQDMQDQVYDFVKGILDEIYIVLPKSNSNKEIYSYFEKLTSEKFNLDYLAMWSLGSYAKAQIPDDLKKEYMQVAKRYMVINYGNVFTKYYETYSYEITGAERLEENSYAVNFYIEPKNNQKQDNAISAQWKIEIDDETSKMLVTDIIVNGISLANAQRFEFERSIKDKQGDLAEFVKYLKANVELSEKNLGIQ